MFFQCQTYLCLHYRVILCSILFCFVTLLQGNKGEGHTHNRCICYRHFNIFNDFSSSTENNVQKQNNIVIVARNVWFTSLHVPSAVYDMGITGFANSKQGSRDPCPMSMATKSPTCLQLLYTSRSTVVRFPPFLFKK